MKSAVRSDADWSDVVGGVDAVRGVAFQVVQALSDIVDLMLDDRAHAVRIEGREDVVDYEILDREHRRLRVRQAKTRQLSDSWGVAELAAILCAWGELDDADQSDFAIVTDGRLGPTGNDLADLIKEMRSHPDAAVLRERAAKIGRSGVSLPPLDVMRRVEIHSELGSSDSVLAQLEVRVLGLLHRSRVASIDDAVNAVNGLFRRLFLTAGNIDLSQRVVTRDDVFAALKLDPATLSGGLVWSDAVADRYRAVLIEAQRPEFLPPEIVEAASAPTVLHLMSASDDDIDPAPQPLGAILHRRVAALVGPTGQGKTSSLLHLAASAAEQGTIAVVLSAAGHNRGALRRRIQQRIEAAIDEPLAAGAIDFVMVAPDLLLLIDGVSEADKDSRAALRSDLQQLGAQRPVRVVATGRDLPAVLSAIDVVDKPDTFRLTSLGPEARRVIAGRLTGLEPGTVDRIEQRLGDLVNNPMLFLMALSVSGRTVPPSRAAVYEQFLRGLVTRAGAAGEEMPLAVLGAAWADLISENRRTVDHYGWLSRLAAALERIEKLPVWRGSRCNPSAALTYGKEVGLLVRLDPDSGLAPLHDSFADYLAGRALARGEASLPSVLLTDFDEAVLFMIDIGGITDPLALRLARENPLLACRAAMLPAAAGRADPALVGNLLEAFANGCELPLLRTGRGIRMLHTTQFTGVVLVKEGYDVVDELTFDTHALDHPAVLVPADTGSLRLAIKLWSTAVKLAQRPPRRVFQPVPPLDAAVAVEHLREYAETVESEVLRLVDATLPINTRDRVLTAIGPRGLSARVADPTPGMPGNMELPALYRRSRDYDIARFNGEGPDDSTYDDTTVERLMSQHPTNQAAHEIQQALDTLTAGTWPKP